MLTAMSDAEGCLEQLDTANHEMAARALRDCFMVIGEASHSLPSEARDRHPEIPWAKVKGMRNIGTHEYFKFRLDLARATVLDHFPPLRIAVEAIARGE